MQINILTVCYALGVALQLAMSIHGISAYGHSEEIDYIQIDVDQEVELLPSCRHDNKFGTPLLSTPHTHLFCFPLYDRRNSIRR
jgi:hypothetical protein